MVIYNNNGDKSTIEITLYQRCIIKMDKKKINDNEFATSSFIEYNVQVVAVYHIQIGFVLRSILLAIALNNVLESTQCNLRKIDFIYNVFEASQMIWPGQRLSLIHIERYDSFGQAKGHFHCFDETHHFSKLKHSSVSQ